MEMPVNLVLLPGMDGTGELFQPLVDALPDSMRVLVVRYPLDQLRSYADLMNLVQDAVPDGESFLLLAESYSVPLAIRFAATHPPNLKGLIVCAGFAASPVKGWRRAICSLFTPVWFRLSLPVFVLRYFLVGWDASAPLLAEVRGAVASVSAKVLAARLREVLACDVRAELSRVSVPVLYVRALRDRLVSGSSCVEIQRALPHTVVGEIDGPHLILQREPDRVAAIVLDFLREGSI